MTNKIKMTMEHMTIECESTEMPIDTLIGLMILGIKNGNEILR